MTMRRVWRRFDEWECHASGMWNRAKRGSVADHLKNAIEFTGDAETYGAWMMHVIREWPVTCEHHLTDLGHNRLAHIGHCAVAMAIGCPENITRAAWALLTQEQRDAANAVAAEALTEWEQLYSARIADDADRGTTQAALWPRAGCLA